ELLRLLVESKRSAAACRERAEAYRAARTQLSEEELIQVEAVLDIKRVLPTLDDALGLMDPKQRTRAPQPVARKVAALSAAPLGCLKSLDELIQKNRETPVRVPSYEGEQEALLGNLGWWEFPQTYDHVPIEKDAARLPARELWEKWYSDRPRKLQDRDGL